MPYNLLDEAWLPIRIDGGRKWIAPWQITEDQPGDGCARALDSPRTDFDGALLELLIAVVQTCMPPADKRHWREMRRNPPSPAALREAFSVHADAFKLDGSGPRFMQDLTLSEKDKITRCEIGALLIDAPGENTLKKNADLFVKRGCVERLCPACVAAALYTLNAYAPQGGAGIRTSLRGGGPLTTLVTGRTLWEAVANNLLPKDVLGGECDSSKPREGGVFPWLVATRTSESGERTLPHDVCPEHMYWAMPRRVRIEFQDSTGPCSLCGKQEGSEARGFISRKGGYNYEGPWGHPLTPYRDMGENRLSLKGDGVAGYPNWLGLTYGEEDAVDIGIKSPVIPAKVVRNFLECVRNPGKEQYRLRLHGYATENMKALFWTQSEMPLMVLDDSETYETVVDLAARLSKSALVAAESLRSCLRRGLVSERRGPTPLSATVFENATSRFWASTEQGFFDTLAKGRELLRLGQDMEKQLEDLRTHWLASLRKEALGIYDDLTERSETGVEDMERIVRARLALQNYCGMGSKVMREILVLPEPASKPKTEANA